MGDDAVTDRGPITGLRVAAATEPDEPRQKSK
jgi:hypothetical protein